MCIKNTYMVNAISRGIRPIRIKLDGDVDLKTSLKINYSCSEPRISKRAKLHLMCSERSEPRILKKFSIIPHDQTTPRAPEGRAEPSVARFVASYKNADGSSFLKSVEVFDHMANRWSFCGLHECDT